MRGPAFLLVVFCFIGFSAHLNAQAETDKTPLTFEKRFSKGLNNAIQERLQPLHKSHVMDDPVEKRLIQVLLGVDRLGLWPTGNDKPKSVSVTVIKPGKPAGVVRSFAISSDDKTIQFHYKSLVTGIDNAVAVVTIISLKDNQLYTVDRILFYSEKQSKWELAPLKGVVGLGTKGLPPQEPGSSSRMINELGAALSTATFAQPLAPAKAPPTKVKDIDKQSQTETYTHLCKYVKVRDVEDTLKVILGDTRGNAKGTSTFICSAQA